jgi:hypothetical protein
VTHAFYHFQFPNGSIQRFGDTAKAIYQPMGDLIGIPPGYTVKQKHFQYLMLPKTVQSKFFISGFYPLPMLFVDRHYSHLCYFYLEIFFLFATIVP